MSAETVVRTLQAVAPPETTAVQAVAMTAWRKRLLRMLIGLVVVAGAAALLLSLLSGVLDPRDYPWLLVAASLALGFLRLDAYGSSVSLSPVVVVASAALGGPAGGAMAGFATALGMPLRAHTRPTVKTIFNFGAMSLAGAASGLPFLFFHLAAQPNWLWLPLLGAASALAMYAANLIALCSAIALEMGASPVYIWRERFRWAAPQNTMLGMVGTGLAASYRTVGAYEIAAFALPVAAMYIAWRQYLAHTRQSVEELRCKNADLVTMANRLRATNEKLSETYKGTLEALIGALDARDNETEGHSYRVSAYSQIVAEKMGIRRGSVEWETIARGALLHDVGKIGVRDGVLLKPGALSDAEWVEMRSHAGIGHEILTQVEFLRPAAELVWSHHERYDGLGYPRGLKGEEIPLGARIFSVADAFDAMTSDRPYRKAMSPDLALAEIHRCAGSQFDPAVVQAFEEVWLHLWAVREQARQMVA